MSEEKISSKCSGCGAYLIYNPNSDKLICPHCKKEKNLALNMILTTKKSYSQKSEAVKNVNKVDTIRCENCGAVIDVDTRKVISNCPYCGSTSISSVKNSLEYIPDGVIPFSVNKEQARNFYDTWIKKKWLAPRDLKKYAKLDKLTGKYVPAWVFDSHIFTKYSGVGLEVRIHGKERRVTKHPFSGTNDRDYTNFYINADPSKTPGFAFSKLGDFGFSNLRVFSSEYILGFLTSNVSQDLHTSWKNAREYMKDSTDSKIRASTGYAMFESFDSSHIFSNIKWLLVYLPVWVCTYVYRKKEYSFYINGATGKIEGKAPLSKIKMFFIIFFIILIAILLGYLAMVSDAVE